MSDKPAGIGKQPINDTVRYLKNAHRCRDCGKPREDGYAGEDFLLGGWACWDCVTETSRGLRFHGAEGIEKP